MEYSVYESINKKENVPINTFVASIEKSTVHWHSEYELIGILKGQLNARIGTEEMLLSKGDIVLINPNEMHSLKAEGKEECLCFVLQLDEILLENDNGEIHFYLNSSLDEDVDCGYPYLYGLLAQIVYEGLGERKDNTLKLKALIYTLLSDLLQYVVYDHHYRDKELIDEKKMVITAIDQMNQNMNNVEVIEEICNSYGVSRKTLDRYFNSVLGLSAKAVLADLRIDRAKQLLKNTDKTMNFIIDNCGYGSEKTFYRVFKEATGMTPADFRQIGVVTNKVGTFNGYLDYDHLRAKQLLKETIRAYNEDCINVIRKKLEKI